MSTDSAVCGAKKQPAAGCLSEVLWWARHPRVGGLNKNARAACVQPIGRILVEQTPPVGCKQYHTDSPALPEKSGFPRRVCLRKGCTEIFIPRVGNQRYCQTAQCLREVHRWQQLPHER